MKLIIGNKNYSSWSLRAWIVLAKLGLDFEEIFIALDTDGFKERIQSYSSAGKVPTLIDGDLAVWDSLAIAEYLAESHTQLWPKNAAVRAHARCVAAEMHSGFFALRQAMPMNCRATGRVVERTPALDADIDRVLTIWRKCRTKYAQNGPWLFGSFSIADAMYAPVVFRFNTYGVECGDLCAEYMRMVLDDAAIKKWFDAARMEKEIIEGEEVGRV